MTVVTINSLAPALQKQVESARTALDRGRPDQALELCAAVLALQPDCLQVRKLERAAQLKQGAQRRGLVAQIVGAVSTEPFVFSVFMKLQDDPRSAFSAAERLLRRNPQSIPALHLLGQAATGLGWSETAVFAHETASDLEPERIDLLLVLGRAYLAAGRAVDAVSAVQQVLHLESPHAEAKTLLQHGLVAVTVAEDKSPPP